MRSRGKSTAHRPQQPELTPRPRPFDESDGWRRTFLHRVVDPLESDGLVRLSKMLDRLLVEEGSVWDELEESATAAELRAAAADLFYLSAYLAKPTRPAAGRGTLSTATHGQRSRGPGTRADMPPLTRHLPQVLLRSPLPPHAALSREGIPPILPLPPAREGVKRGLSRGRAVGVILGVQRATVGERSIDRVPLLAEGGALGRKPYRLSPPAPQRGHLRHPIEMPAKLKYRDERRAPARDNDVAHRSARKRAGPWRFWERAAMAELERFGRVFLWPDSPRLARHKRAHEEETEMKLYQLWLYKHRPPPGC